jgi:arsenite-transporting ATPase
MMYAYQQPTEMIGGDKLDMLADMIYGDSDPTEIYATESPMKFVTENNIDMIILKLPFAEKNQVELFKSGDDSIVVHVGSQKRTINLPMTLAKEEMIGAELKDHVLKIKFKRESNEQK